MNIHRDNACIFGRDVYCTHRFLVKSTTKLVINFKQPFFSVLSHQNVFYNSAAIANLKSLSQLNNKAHFGDLKKTMVI